MSRGLGTQQREILAALAGLEPGFARTVPNLVWELYQTETGAGWSYTSNCSSVRRSLSLLARADLVAHYITEPYVPDGEEYASCTIGAKAPLGYALTEAGRERVSRLRLDGQNSPSTR